eukprot:2982880-Heterocapsa_arctica.AAC.1
MSGAAVRDSNQLQCIILWMVKRAQSRAAPPSRRRVPDSDMQHLEFLLCSYVDSVGMVKAFDMGPYEP